MKRIISAVIVFFIVFLFTACAQKSDSKAIVSEVTETQTTVIVEKPTEKAIVSEVTETQTSALAEKPTEKTTEETTEISLPKIEKGTVKGNVYENESLGFKITPPESWEHFEDEEFTENGVLSGDPNEVYNATEWKETEFGYEFKSVSVSINDKSSFKSVDDYIKYLEEHFNDDPDYMKTEKRKPMKIGNREYNHIAFVYPGSKEVYSDIFFCYDRGTLVTIDFMQLNEKEITEFISKYFHKK